MLESAEEKEWKRSHANVGQHLTHAHFSQVECQCDANEELLSWDSAEFSGFVPHAKKTWNDHYDRNQELVPIGAHKDETKVPSLNSSVAIKYTKNDKV